MRSCRATWLGLIAVALLLAAGLSSVAPSRGTHWYRSRPSAYWSSQVRAWNADRYRPGWSAPWPDRLLSLAGAKSGANQPAMLQRDPAAIPVLRDLLADGDPNVRHWACTELAYLPPCPRAVPGIAALLHDPDQWVRVAACLALAAYGADAEPAVPDLVGRLGDAEWRVRHAAVCALENLGPAAGQAIPALRAEQWDPNPIVSSAAARALLKTDPRTLAAVAVALPLP